MAEQLTIAQFPSRRSAVHWSSIRPIRAQRSLMTPSLRVQTLMKQGEKPPAPDAQLDSLKDMGLGRRIFPETNVCMNEHWSSTGTVQLLRNDIPVQRVRDTTINHCTAVKPTLKSWGSASTHGTRSMQLSLVPSPSFRHTCPGCGAKMAA